MLVLGGPDANVAAEDGRKLPLMSNAIAEAGSPTETNVLPFSIWQMKASPWWIRLNMASRQTGGIPDV